MVELAQLRAIGPGGSHLLSTGPARRAIGLNVLGFACPPDGHADRHCIRNEGTRCRDEGALDKNLRCIGIVDEPPPEEVWW